MIAGIDDPIASASGQFPLGAPSGTPSAEDVPSPVGLRPWGLRNLTVSDRAKDGESTTVTRFDHERQLAVDASGVPLIAVGPPTAHTTASTDGEDGPSSEDWINDFHPDEPFQA